VREAPAVGAGAAAGTVVAVGPEGVTVACGVGSAVRLVEVQPESRRVMPADAWAKGARLRPGTRLG
jgi:methionyl-tRNA formyltransferase